MSDTVKLVIDFPKDKYKDFVACYCGNLNCDWLYKRVAEGIPLDDVKAEIETDLSWEMFDEYGNETALHKELMEILDNIRKGDKE